MEKYYNIEEQKLWNESHMWTEGGHEWSGPFGTTENLWNKYIFDNIKEFRGKKFSWMEYMRFYKSAWKKRVFTYPEDWSGYNIPSNVLEKANDTFYKETEYDEIMNNIYFHCALDSQQKNDGTLTPWYLIGASSKDLKTMDHEIAHGLYYTNKEYNKIFTMKL